MIRRGVLRRVTVALATVLVVSAATSASGLSPIVLAGIDGGAGAGLRGLAGQFLEPVEKSNPPLPALEGAGSQFVPVDTSGAATESTLGLVPGAPGTVPDAGAPAATSPAQGDVPARALSAYRAAASAMAVLNPTCGIDWALLAGIGRVESNHGRYGGARLGADGVSRPYIIGIPLDGRPGVARILDTDHGKYDGDVVFDRAVGPMQFLPGTWVRAGADGNGDGVADPHNIDDAALAAAKYLCNGSSGLGDPAGARAALMRYNHSAPYGLRVMALAAGYRQGVTVDGSNGGAGTGAVYGPADSAVAAVVTPPVVAAAAPVVPGAPADPGVVTPPAVDPPVVTPPVVTPPVVDPPVVTPPVIITDPEPTPDPVVCALLPAVEPGGVAAGAGSAGDGTSSAAPPSNSTASTPPSSTTPPNPPVPSTPAPSTTPPTGEPDAGTAVGQAAGGTEPAGTTPEASAAGCDPVAYAAALVAATNAARVAEGLTPLAESQCATAAAVLRATALGGVAELVSASLADVLAACAPATSAAESLSRAAASPSAVVANWLKSPTDRAALLGAGATGIGVGCVLDGERMLCSLVLLGA